MSNMSYPTKQDSQFMNVQGGEKKVMKKILSVALSTAMAFSMFASVAFADTAATTPQQKFDALAAKGILNGYPDQQAHLEKDLTRAEFAKIVTKLFNLKEVNNKLSYKDKGYNAKNWAVPYIEAATAAGLMQGKDTVKGIFDYNGKVTVQEVSAVLFRALKLDAPTATDNNASVWAKGYAQALIDKGLIAKGTNFTSNATRSLVVETVYAVTQMTTAPAVVSAEATSPTEVTVKFANGKETKVTLTTALVEGVETTIPAFTFEGNTYNNVKVTLTAPKVVAATAPNAKQLVISFNRAVDASTLIADGKLKSGVVQVVPVAGAQSPVTVNGTVASLNDAKTAVTITLPNTEFMKGQYTVVVTDAVKTSVGTAFSTYTSLLNVADTTAPTVASVTAVAKTTTNTVTVKLSEPVKRQGVIAYVNGVASTATVSDDTYDTITLTTGTLNSGATYDVSLLNVTDYAGNVANPNPIKTSVTVVTDAAAPTVASITPVSDTYVDVKFNKKMSYESFVGNVRFVDAYGKSLPLAVNTTSNSDTIRLTLPTSLTFPTNNTLAASLEFGATVRDTLGNQLGAAVTQPVTVVKDTTAPTLVSAVYTSGKGLVVTFSENVQANLTTGMRLINETIGQVEAKDFSGAKVSDATVTFPNVTLGAGTYTLSLPAEFVLDVSRSKNKLAASSTTVTVAAGTAAADTKAPVVTLNRYFDSTPTSDIIVRLNVSDEQGLSVASIRDLNSYTLAGKALPAGSSAVLISSDGTTTLAPKNAVVEITIPRGAISETKSYDFVAYGITDTAGNRMASLDPIPMSLTDRVAPTLTGATVSSGDSKVLVLSFSEGSLNNVDAGDFIFTINGSATPATVRGTITQGAGNDAGKYYVSFQNSDASAALDLNAASVNSISVKVADTANITDAYSNKITTGTEVYAR
ncbi:S-layer homology domain-containing protein [Paenibacillus glufosinatiresistens]|uniref:S-layer homology domain-containing protein n=1 Tax=Paenibacillus glufosinatiresistens TaxID=3070657 RepID=UPI00286E71B2|nr:S-layer homology domain-containing protein [Paenibacillus sp. YX.27]